MPDNVLLTQCHFEHEEGLHPAAWFGGIGHQMVHGMVVCTFVQSHCVLLCIDAPDGRCDTM